MRIVACLFSCLLVGCGGVVRITIDEPDAGPSTDSSISTVDSFSDDVSTEPDVVVGPDVTVDSGCTDLRCKRPACGTTTITGTVHMPNGTTPLYDAIVYVPNGDVPPLPKGVQCDKCGALPSDPIATSLTDAKGHFVLTNVPAGADIPVVVQLGKWRRRLKTNVMPCVENKLDPEATRMPKNRSEGEMPRIAVTVGACDKIACLLPKIGIDSSEFGIEGSLAAVHFYQPSSTAAGPAGMTSARTLWSDTTKLSQYDIAIFSCECSESSDTKDDTSFAAVTAYLNSGGRLLTTDFQYVWYKNSPDPALRSSASIPGGAPTGGNPAKFSGAFPKGSAFTSWIGSSSVMFDFVFNNIASASSTPIWATSSGGMGGAGPGDNPRVVTFHAPASKPPAEQCGRAIHLDVHANQSDTVDSSFPAGCFPTPNDGQRALQFFFFEAQTCIQNDVLAPVPPPAK